MRGMEGGLAFARPVRFAPRMTPRPAHHVAAVDLGSNSFHMLVAKIVDGRIHVVDKLRELVVLADGLDAQRKLDAKTQVRALACLERFGQRLRDLKHGAVRAVGTNTMRQVRDGGRFVAKAQKALGHPIDVIPGKEEARLVYLGVAHDLSDDAGRRLVVDIGGGSTECILGERFEPQETHSLFMGCVTYTRRFFGSGNITDKALDKAFVAALLEMRSIKRRFLNLGWETCVGSSGTILTIAQILKANGWSERGITAKGLKRLRRALLDARTTRRLDLNGLPEERRATLPGGAAILSAIFESLQIERMDPSGGSLREGVIYDLLGRIHHEDVRDRTIKALAERYHVDLEQAARVERTAQQLFQGVAEAWEIDVEDGARSLSWASRLFEVGMSIAYSGYHKHGAYLVANSDMPGFSRDDQHLLAAIIRSHRGKLRDETFAELSSSRARLARRLAIVLRLAVLLNRSRTARALPPLGVAVSRRGLRLALSRDWLREHPLTRADLDAEAAVLARERFQLEVTETRDLA